LKSVELGILGVIAAIMTLIDVNEIIVLFGTGAIGMLLYLIKSRKSAANTLLPLLFLQGACLPPILPRGKHSGYFLKLVPYCMAAAMCCLPFRCRPGKNGHINKQVLIDAIAVGQFTPGPVFSSATFIGWQIGGFAEQLPQPSVYFYPPFCSLPF